MFIEFTGLNDERAFIVKFDCIECVYVDEDRRTVISLISGAYYFVKETYIEVKNRIANATPRWAY